MTRTSLCIAALAAALAACSAHDDIEDNRAIDTSPDKVLPGQTNPPEIGIAAASKESSAAATNNMKAPGDAASATVAIPATYQGRWGMVPLDCTGDPSAAKGLIAIDDKTIKFYESRATLKDQRPVTGTGFSGLFAFAGEGQQWTKVETLTRTGDTLKRADEDGTYNYTRCH